VSREITVALAGNPNSGKTTVFNNVTGSRQHVGNWPGVTVEKREGNRTYDGYTMKVVDLPGVYSLTAYSMDEIVARNFIVDEKPDVVVDIVDASNLERNLYLTVQLLETGTPLVVVLNMMDEARSRGYDINVEQLSKLLGAPVVPMVASRNRGTEELLDKVISVVDETFQAERPRIEYGREIEEEIANLEGLISQDPGLSAKYSSRWLAMKLLEEDEEVIKKVGN
jgi:small GTP-binding protein